MQINISDKVKKYLQKKNSSVITVQLLSSRVCWGGATMLDIVITEPVDQEKYKYNYYNVDGIDIYLRKIFDVRKELSFSLSSLGFFKQITVHVIIVIWFHVNNQGKLMPWLF